MRFKSSLGPASEQSPSWTRKRAWILSSVLGSTMVLAALLSFAQGPSPQHPILLPEANRPPDANQQMEMREQKTIRQNFDATNAERLKEMTEASEMLETMAIALKAEVDNSSSTRLSQNAIHKAETIEKLARAVKERMQLTISPN